MEWGFTFAEQGVASQLYPSLSYAFVIGTLLYLRKQSLLPNSKQFQTKLSKIVYIHNISLSLFSLLMAVVMVYETVIENRYNSWYDLACRVTPNAGLYGLVNFAFLWSKVWEYFDTVFLVLKRKPVIPLHLWHHLTTFTMAAVSINFPVGALMHINCWIHTVMYLHFAHPRKEFRQIITTLQITQFVVVIVVHLYTLFSGCHPSVGLVWEYYYDLVIVGSYLVMFLQFYIREYFKPTPPRESKPKNQ